MFYLGIDRIRTLTWNGLMCFSEAAIWIQDNLSPLLIWVLNTDSQPKVFLQIVTIDSFILYKSRENSVKIIF